MLLRSENQLVTATGNIGSMFPVALQLMFENILVSKRNNTDFGYIDIGAIRRYN